MKTRSLALAALVALVAALQPAPAKLKIVATLPDFAAIAREIGGERVEVSAIARGTEDAHFVDGRYSFVRLLNTADVLIEGGAELEAGWLPPLVNSARNARIQADAPGHVILSRSVRLIQTPTVVVDRSMGDVHPLGNPHFWLDPANCSGMARGIADALSRLDPPGAAAYATNLARFTAAMNEGTVRWQKRLAPWRGAKVITYHKSFDYLLEAFALVLAGTIEPKPGIEPSPTHIHTLVTQHKDAGVKLVVIEPFRPRKTAEQVANAIGARVLVLPEKVGGHDKADTPVHLFDFVVEQLAAALEQAR